MISFNALYGLLSILVTFVEPAKILCMFPVPSYSHQTVLQAVVELLSKQGHELVMMTALPRKYPLENVKEIDVHNISQVMWEKRVTRVLKNQYKGFSPLDDVALLRVTLETMESIVDTQLSMPEMQALIQDEKQNFDLILIEECVSSTIMIGARFKAPVILISSYYGNTNSLRIVGAERHPEFYPDFHINKYINMTLLEKFWSWRLYTRLYRLYCDLEEITNNIIRKHFGEHAPSMQDLLKNVQMLFINIHPIWDHGRPVPPALFYMGALHVKESKPLPEALKTYLDSSRNGVIYMSLGSKVKSSELPQNILRVILSVFASLPYNIIWKWEVDELPGVPKNVRLEKWLPQNDLLNHPSVKIFITHGGLQSMDEAIAARVPVLGLPIFGDQFMNVQNSLLHGVGLQLDINDLSEDEFRKAIMMLIKDHRFRDNIVHLARIMDEQRGRAANKTLRFIEYVAKHGATYLRSPLADISFSEYFMLDILCFFLIMVIIALILLRVLLYTTIKIIKKKYEQVKVQSQNTYLIKYLTINIFKQKRN